MEKRDLVFVFVFVFDIPSDACQAPRGGGKTRDETPRALPAAPRAPPGVRQAAGGAGGAGGATAGGGGGTRRAGERSEAAGRSRGRARLLASSAPPTMSQPQAAPVACSAFYGRSYPAPYVAPDGSVRAAYGGVIGPLAAWAGRAAFGRGGYAADVASAKVHGGAGALLGGARARTLSGAAPLRRARAIDTLAKARAVRAGRVYKKAPGGAAKSKAAQTPRSKAEELKVRTGAPARTTRLACATHSQLPLRSSSRALAGATERGASR